MKKWTAVLLSAMLVLGITACGNAKEATGGNNTAAEQPAGETKETAAAPTVDELIQKTADASKDLKSFSMDASVKQNITVSQGDQKQEQKVDMQMKTDMTKEPLNMYQEIKMSIPDQGEQDIKQYITQEGIYSQVAGTWTKVPDEMKDQLMATVEASAKPEQQLEQFKSISKDAKVSVEGNDYVLSADLSGEGLKELAKSLMSQSGNDQQTAALMEQMNIKNIKITYGVNKDTYLPTKSDVNMTMDMEQDGQGMSMEMIMTSTFSKHNEVGEIKVPQEVLDSAK
ncbi:DUF6612 family protein [Paenibacillus apiarius]|uniref:Lipoprotein n=1 Tax=Paenibacillus apiarius TaxID=46240 RepID=A0ABT4DY15_9BACL|nr:DUF6612 family protein [Paenibacillus apiarius]MBN3525130.1 hypothetical protein [Paenibacillus apiarius]MCY9517479.1 hypothetical protein [Paenibacillus apiarius]MCY9522242.1 hypothetical protein [Paenibacillus apiarius]MCY9552276.1 hypothetical protein [Paenibacillus apiarius]MCY9560155.1 hypothetical protein [Paenibacillus apiarius]